MDFYLHLTYTEITMTSCMGCTFLVTVHVLPHVSVTLYDSRINVDITAFIDKDTSYGQLLPEVLLNLLKKIY